MAAPLAAPPSIPAPPTPLTPDNAALLKIPLPTPLLTNPLPITPLVAPPAPPLTAALVNNPPTALTPAPFNNGNSSAGNAISIYYYT